MFEKLSYQCPNCGIELLQGVEQDDHFTCTACQAGFRVLLDKETGKAAFIEEKEKEIPEPLYIPRGSIRALVTILSAVSCWVLIFMEKDLPPYLSGLMLTIIGYYFGFRAKMKSAQSRIFDASAVKQEPLFMPAGVIRTILIMGFLVGAVFSYARGKLSDIAYLEFFIVLLGLIAGFVYAKIFARARETPGYLLVNHVKGFVVIASALLLTTFILSGVYLNQVHLSILLAAIISFYFGSRS